MTVMESPEHEEQAVREYVTEQLGFDDLGDVTHVEKVASHPVMGVAHDVWDVHTRAEGRWWVVTSPMNLYTQDDFKSVDVVVTFHVGLAVRVAAVREPNARSQELEWLRESRRRWEQAAEDLDQAKEVEEFQAVGMRLRETLLTFVAELASDEFVPHGENPPKRADFTRWSELIAGGIARGERLKHLRSYLKSLAVESWQYINWLTHARGATVVDGGLAVSMVDHLLSTFGTVLLRAELGEPAKCPACGSHRIAHDQRQAYVEQGLYVVLCGSCDWREERPLALEVNTTEDYGPPPRPEGECTPSSDIKTMMRLDDVRRRR